MILKKLELEIELVGRDEFDRFVQISNETVTDHGWSFKPLNVTAITAKICNDGDLIYSVNASIDLLEHSGQEARFVNAEPYALAKIAETLAKILSL